MRHGVERSFIKIARFAHGKEEKVAVAIFFDAIKAGAASSF